MPGFGLADAVLIFTMVTWGVNIIFIKIAVSQLSPMVFTSVRHVGASALLLGILALRRSEIRFHRRDWLLVALVGLMGIPIHQPLAMYAVKYTTTGNAALLLSSTPVVLSLFNHFLGRERLSSRAWFGVLTSFAGMAIVIGGDGDGFSLDSEHFVGDLLALAGVLTWALFTLLSQPLLARHDALTVSALSVAAGTIMLGLLALPAINAQDWQAIGPDVWLSIGYSTIIVIGLGILIWNWSVKKLGSTRTSLYSNLSPVVTLIAGVLILGESLTLLRAAGAAIIIGGIYLSRSSTIVRTPELEAVDTQ